MNYPADGLHDFISFAFEILAEEILWVVSCAHGKDHGDAIICTQHCHGWEYSSYKHKQKARSDFSPFSYMEINSNYSLLRINNWTSESKSEFFKNSKFIWILLSHPLSFPLWKINLIIFHMGVIWSSFTEEFCFLLPWVKREKQIEEFQEGWSGLLGILKHMGFLLHSAILMPFYF